jgi:hypothetical protein
MTGEGRGRAVVLARADAGADALKSCKPVYARKALPGVVILVHGVNSDGEWYAPFEVGLCRGLNRRLRREDAHCAHPHEVGQLRAGDYRSELTPDGFIDRTLGADSFVSEAGDSPVIRFRWGYRATKAEKALFGAGILLNEKDAWGGGPFANGTSALADCWGDEGFKDSLFAWLTVQSMNPLDTRKVYACPPRAYYAHAAWRLARLVALVREHQPEVPITIVGHSQGTMIAMASAFVGARKLGGSGVADTYHLVSSPYNLSMTGLPADLDNLAQRGRVAPTARAETFRRFLGIVAERAGKAQNPALVDRLALNPAPIDGTPGCTVAGEHAADRDHHGRVFVHCNPHDQVISALTVQGIGWKGLSAEDRRAVGATDRLRQRVWAQGLARPHASGTVWRVGAPSEPTGANEAPSAPGSAAASRTYHFWHSHHRAEARMRKRAFWSPPSARARFRWETVTDPRRAVGGRLGVAVLGTIATALGPLINQPVNADPHREHEIVDDAPPVPEPIVPRLADGRPFDAGLDPDHARMARRSAIDDPADPYNAARSGPLAPLTDEMQGDAQSEAALRYEHHAQVRAEARARGGADADAADRLDGTDREAMAHLRERGYDAMRVQWLLNGRNASATDHSTIVMNPEHAEKVFAWDLPLGYVAFEDANRPGSPKDEEVWLMLRRVADWRWTGHRSLPAKPKEDGTYFEDAQINGEEVHRVADYRTDALDELGIARDRERYGPDALE